MANPHEQAPQPPKVRPKLRFHKVELLGMAAIAVLPISAMLGAFGPSTTTVSEQIGSIRVEAEYPGKLRTAMHERISLELVNLGRQPARDLTVNFDRQFMEAFSELGMTPEPERAYAMEIAEIGPGERHRIEIEVHAAEYGLHEGRIEVAASGASGFLPLRTMIFP